MRSLLEAAERRPRAALALLCAALYAQTLGFGLTLLDDNVYMVDRLPFLLDWGNLPSLFTRSSFLESSGGFYYRPVLILSKMLDAQLGRGAFAVFHLSNVAFHAAATVLAWSVLGRLGVARERALFLAAVFAVHPVSVQAVAWMPGRTDTLLAVFALASFRCYLDLAAGGGARAFAGHAVFLALALLTKELAVVLPAACAGHALLLAKPRPTRRALLGLALTWAAALGAWKLVRAAVLDNPQGHTARAAFNSVYENLPALPVYLGKIVLPVGLSPYPILRDAFAAPGLLALLALAAAFAASRTKDLKAWAWGLGWFLAFLLPSFVYPPSAILPVFYEYRAYLPLVGLLFAVSTLDWVWGLRPAIRALALAALAAASLRYSRVYSDAVPHWTRAVEASPHSAFARKQLGTAWLFRGNAAGAIDAFVRAIELQPREPMARNNLGVVLMGLGRLDEARALFQEELLVNPGYDAALANLGIVHEKLGDPKRAAAFFRKALEVNPRHQDAARRLAALGAN